MLKGVWSLSTMRRFSWNGGVPWFPRLDLFEYANSHLHRMRKAVQQTLRFRALDNRLNWIDVRTIIVMRAV